MTDNMTDEPTENEMEVLKQRADVMGLKYHPSIGEDKLREKIRERLISASPEDTNTTGDDNGPAEAGDSVDASLVTERPETEAELRYRKKKEASELVRIQVTCMNPNKRELEGEIFSSGNSLVGTMTKYVPYGSPWHVPRIIFNQINQRKCQVFYTTRDSQGRQIRRGKLIKEFNIEVLPNLTSAEVKELRQRQAMAAGQDD